MEILNITLQAGVTQQLRRGGVGLEILSASYPLNLNTYEQNGGQNASMTGVQGGQFLSLKFGGFDIVSTTAQNVRVLVLDEGEGGGSRNVALNGSLNLSTVPASQSLGMTALQKNVTTASTQVLAANAGRQYLLLQNNDPNATFWVQVAGAAVVGNCIKILPGGFWEPPTVPTGSINVIGSAASALFTVVEG